MFFSKKLLAIVVIYSSFLSAEQPLSLSLNPDEDFLPATKAESQFFYIAGGINPLPTFSLGYRKLYSSFGSDFSISVAIMPAVHALLPLPAVVYKQLFFPIEGWKEVKRGMSVFYLGLDMGFCPFAMNGGGLIGWQFKRKARSDFCEIGINPLNYIFYNNKLRVLPAASLTYAFMF